VRLHYQTAENAVNRYDAQQLACMLNNLAEGDLAIEVGANCGQCSIIMAATCGTRGTVIAFEPHPQARDVLKRNFDLNLSVKRALLSSRAAILCELHPYVWPRFGNSLPQLKDLAAQYGRRIRYLDQNSEIGENAAYGIVALERSQ
jgi:hypothetical protein